MTALRAIPFAVGIALIGFTALAQSGAEGYHAQCRALYDQRVLDSAEAICKLALSSDPQYLPSLKLLARIDLDQRQLDSAETYLQQAAGLAPADPEVAFLQARSLLLQNRPAEALGRLPQSSSVQVTLVRARALEALGRFEEAYQTYLRAIAVPEARLGAAKLAEKLGRPSDATDFLGDSPPEQLAKARLLWLSGQTRQSADALENILPRLGPLEADYTKTLGLLAVVYYGLGEVDKGELVLRQLSARTSLPSNLLSKIWPWMVVLLLYLALILYGESRIEPMRTVEINAEQRVGPGSVHLWMLAALALSGLAAVGVGWWLFSNLLAAFTPVQGQVVRPIFYFLLGGLALLIALRSIKRNGLARALGPTGAWVEGTWAAVVLLLLLGLYGYFSVPLGLSSLSALYPVFFGLALLEVVIRGMGHPLFQERYRELSNFMIPLLFALVIPGPTLYFLMAAFFLTWLYRRTGGALAGATAWVLAGTALALVGNLPMVRTILGS